LAIEEPSEVNAIAKALAVPAAGSERLRLKAVPLIDGLRRD
jgi:hypothetical protein